MGPVTRCRWLVKLWREMRRNWGTQVSPFYPNGLLVPFNLSLLFSLSGGKIRSNSGGNCDLFAVHWIEALYEGDQPAVLSPARDRFIKECLLNMLHKMYFSSSSVESNRKWINFSRKILISAAPRSNVHWNTIAAQIYQGITPHYAAGNGRRPARAIQGHVKKGEI